MPAAKATAGTLPAETLARVRSGGLPVVSSGDAASTRYTYARAPAASAPAGGGYSGVLWNDSATNTVGNGGGGGAGLLEAQAGDDAVAPAAPQPSFGYESRPLPFEPNLGQAESGDFVAHGFGYSLAVNEDGVELELPVAEGETAQLSMNFVGSTYVTGFMIGNGYFGSLTVLP